MAVDNFQAFKRLMIKRNAELTVQAEAMMSSKPEATAKAIKPEEVASQSGLTDQERKDI